MIHAAQFGNPRHYRLTDTLVQFLSLVLSTFLLKIHGLAERYFHRMPPQPGRPGREHLIRAPEVDRHHGTSGFGHEHPDAGFAGLQRAIQRSRPFRKNDHGLAFLEQLRRGTERLAIQPLGLQRNPPQPPKDRTHQGPGKQIGPPEIKQAPPHPASQQRNIRVTRVVRRQQHPAPGRDVFNAPRAIAQEHAADRASENPQDSIRQAAHE